MEDLSGRLDSLPIIVREQTTWQQRLIGRQSMGEFNDKVYETVRRVPRGKVVSYGQVARLIGQPRKARFVGYAMHGNPDPWDCADQTGSLATAWCSRMARLRLVLRSADLTSSERDLPQRV